MNNFILNKNSKMKKKISNPLSDYKKYRGFSQPRIIDNASSKVNININQLSEIYTYLYDDFFPSILCLSKASFFEKINKAVKEAISYNNSQEFQSPQFQRQISKIKEEITKKYDNDYKILSTEYQNYLKNGRNFNYLTHFRKHCTQTDKFALHNCSYKKQGKFIEFKIKNKINNKEEISYVICSECKQCYLSNFILMVCIPCNKKYFSNILGENDNENILPATWEKYHCGPIINEIMKCVKCHNILYLNLKTKQLVCQNKKCNFISNPESILWKCFICSADFTSKAKIYNPLEFKILKKSINFALLLKKKAGPKQLPCGCEKDISKLTFFHKEECKGELYKGMLIDKEIIVCSKCHAINFEEKFSWICPICSIKFHLHIMVGCKPFSKKKYIINKHFNQSVKLISKKNKHKDKKEKYMNNISLYNKKDSDLEPSKKEKNLRHVNSQHSVEVVDPNQSINIEKTIFKREESNNNFYENKNIISLKKGKYISTTAEKRKKHYSTLLEILQARKHSQPKEISKFKINDEKESKNEKPKNTSSSQRLFINNNIIRNKKGYAHYYNRTNDNYYDLYQNENLEKYLEDKLKDNKNVINNSLTTGLISLNINNPNDQKETKKIKVNKKFNNKLTTPNADESINDSNKKQKDTLKPYESTDLSSLKTLSSNNGHIPKNNLFYSISSSNRTSKPINIFRYKNRKPKVNNDNSKGFEDFRSSKLTNPLTESSYQEMINDLRFSSNLKVDTFNSSNKLSRFNSTSNEIKDTNKKLYNNINEISQEIPEIKPTDKLILDLVKNEKEKEENVEDEEEEENDEDIINEKIKIVNNRKENEENSLLEKEIQKIKDKDNEDDNENSENRDEMADKFEEIPSKFRSKKNIRESIALNFDLIFQNVLISQDKLNSLAKNTSIPSFKETDYNILKSIGEGTYGVVYLVENNETYEQFALKKIVCRDYNELIKHKNELELIYSVKHENILNLIGIQFKYLDETTSAIYVLMELAQNDWNMEIKRRILAKKYYKESEIIRILKQIIKGFLFLQDKDIAHRDVKPQNILLFPNNVYKIADFGEAKNIKNIAQQSTLRGSELYMSPVLYKGYKFNQKNIMHNPYKSDVFSLGYCLLYAICLNLKVLESVRELTTLRGVISSINKFIMKNKYSDKLMNLIYKMIEPNEDDRIDFEDLSIELDNNFK